MTELKREMGPLLFQNSAFADLNLLPMREIPTTQGGYEHQPNGVVETENVKIVWDFSAETDSDTRKQEDQSR